MDTQSTETLSTDTGIQHNPNTFTIRTPVFEGPLDLLLNLIEKKKLYISDISLAKVTDDYINHINELPEYSLKHRTQFILIASTLLLIKAKSLLPTLELTPEEQGDIKDLERRLKILELMRKRGAMIKDMYGSSRIFPRGDMDETICVFAPSQDITTEQLHKSISTILTNLPKAPTEQKAVVRKVISLEEMMDRLETRIQSAMKMTFREFSRANKSADTPEGAEQSKAMRVDIIISFLAMLELVKQGAIDVRQEQSFDDIEMEKIEITVPVYNIDNSTNNESIH